MWVHLSFTSSFSLLQLFDEYFVNICLRDFLLNWFYCMFCIHLLALDLALVGFCSLLCVNICPLVFCVIEDMMYTQGICFDNFWSSCIIFSFWFTLSVSFLKWCLLVNFHQAPIDSINGFRSKFSLNIHILMLKIYKLLLRPLYMNEMQSQSLILLSILHVPWIGYKS